MRKAGRDLITTFKCVHCEQEFYVEAENDGITRLGG